MSTLPESPATAPPINERDRALVQATLDACKARLIGEGTFTEGYAILRLSGIHQRAIIASVTAPATAPAVDPHAALRALLAGGVGAAERAYSLTACSCATATPAKSSTRTAGGQT